jgi:hypothetical protein
MFVECSFAQKRVLQPVGFQESISVDTCLSTHILAMGIHVTISRVKQGILSYSIYPVL